MLEAIIRERKRRKWKTRAKAMDRAKQLEKQLGRYELERAPDATRNMEGILIVCHRCRGRFGKPDLRFEFSRKDPLRGPTSDYGEQDLDALMRAIEACKTYLSKQAAPR